MTTMFALPAGLGWQDFGRCAETNGELDWLLFPGRGARTAADAMAVAELCGPCPVRVQCRRHGVDNNEHGVWGGVLRSPAA